MTHPAKLPQIVVAGTNASAARLAQNASLAITSLTASELESRNISSIIDLAHLVPNLTQASVGVRSYANTYALRGIANTEFLSDAAVVLYVDDVPAGDVVSYPMDLIAVERVEVYRGPQGTRFGRNSEAGVINLVTRQPSNLYESEAKVSAGTFDTYQFSALAQGPVVADKLFFSLAGQYGASDGFIHNTFLDSHADQRESINGRAVLSWLPNEHWSVDFTTTADKYHDGLGLVPLFAPMRTINSDFDGKLGELINSQSLRVRGEVDGTIWTSITARRDFRLDPFLVDPFFDSNPGNSGVNTIKQTQWSEELRVQPLISPDPWDWKGGFFFSHTDTDVGRFLDFVISPVFTGHDVVRQHQGSDTYALFGDVTRSVGPKLYVTLGLRLDYTMRHFDGERFSNLGPPPPSLNESPDYFNVAPKITLAYHFTEAMQVYGSTGRGFKPGGFSMFIDNPAQREGETEELWASEVGLKSSWLDGRLVANVAAFYYDVKNYQVEQFGPGLSLTIANAPSARTMGVEVELVAHPARGWSCSGFFGYTDALLDRYTDPFTAITVHDVHPQGVAEFNGGVSVEYRHPSGVFSRVSYTVVGDTFYDSMNSPGFEQAAYGLLSARVGFEHGHFGVYLFGDNLTDESYYSKKTQALGAGAPGRPQTFGVMVSAHY